jgi:hypothetical protein
MPGVARNYTAHLFSIQAKCYLGDVAETRVRTAMPPQLLCGVRAAGWQKVRLKFLYVWRPLVRLLDRMTVRHNRAIRGGVLTRIFHKKGQTSSKSLIE